MSKTYFFEQQDGSRIAYNILEPCNPENIEKNLCMGVKELFMGLKEVIVFDNRGIGESSVVSSYDPISIDLMAEDTIALIRHLKIKRLNLLGWSMGGRIAVYIASNLPQDIELEKLIICSSPVQPPKTSDFETFYNLQKSLGVPKNIQEQKDNIRKTSEKSFIKYMDEHPDIFDKFAEIKFKAHFPLEIAQRQWEAIKKAEILSKLQKITVPTLIIHGKADGAVSIKEGELIACNIPNNKFISIPEVGHIFWLEAPESANFINEFLSD
ncbi:3-oxoadipate enol-lactone hydrolase [Gigaspora margarita]|uniref:3-oxoadipate enol-lactone hydrolase n=1 Tax=Gigaspora margarita TaxID=4874 RepID=A0A8H3WWQ7_GIGMA|nr:3-oxoadipate enol-lactone hydrolase [Gigaspora margarita]